VTQVPTLRPMGLLEIVDQTFRLYRSNFWLFFGIAAVLNLPLGFLQAVPNSVVSRTATALAVVCALVVSAALTRAVSDRYMGDPATVGGSYLFTGRRRGELIGTILASYSCIALGVLVLVVCMIIFAFWAAFVSEVFVIENKRYFAAIWRSKFLIGQGVWAQFLVLGIVTGLIAALIQSPAYALMMITTMSQGEPSHLWIAGGIISGLTASLAMPITLVATILLYYDSRIRKEGFDLEVLARELGRQLPSSSGPSAPAAPTAAPWPPVSPEAPSGGGGC